jgi:uncharacterized membrane protein
MTAAYSFIVAIHGAIGIVALLAFWTAAVLRKGSPLHRRVGQGYLVAMAGIIVTALPLAGYKLQMGKPVVAAFLAYLAVITATTMWSAWRAIRDKDDVRRYTGAIYTGLAWLCLVSGVGVLALGAKVGSPLLAGFSAVGIFAGQDMLRTRFNRDRLAAQPRWWITEHYSAMLGNGVATHIAFLGIGLPKLLPAVADASIQYLAWFGPLAVALVAKRIIDRRWRPPARVADHPEPRPA